MKTDNFSKVLPTSIVSLLVIIVVKDIDLPPNAQADIWGNNLKYQIEYFRLSENSSVTFKCCILNIKNGIVMRLTSKNIKDFKRCS